MSTTKQRVESKHTAPCRYRQLPSPPLPLSSEEEGLDAWYCQEIPPIVSNQSVSSCEPRAWAIVIYDLFTSMIIGFSNLSELDPQELSLESKTMMHEAEGIFPRSQEATLSSMNRYVGELPLYIIKYSCLPSHLPAVSHLYLVAFLLQYS